MWKGLAKSGLQTAGSAKSSRSNSRPSTAVDSFEAAIWHCWVSQFGWRASRWSFDAKRLPSFLTRQLNKTLGFGRYELKNTTSLCITHLEWKHCIGWILWDFAVFRKLELCLDQTNQIFKIPIPLELILRVQVVESTSQKCNWWRSLVCKSHF